MSAPGWISPNAVWKRIRTSPMAATEKIGSALLRAPGSALGGARIPHAPASALRILRAGDHRPRRARYALNRFLGDVRGCGRPPGGARIPHAPASALRILRAGDHRPRRARYVLNRSF